MKKKTTFLLCVIAFLTLFSKSSAQADSDVAKVGEKTYSSLEDAIASVEGTNKAVELMADCVLDIGNIDYDVIIKGEGLYTVEVPTQTLTNNSESQGRLNVQARLIFDGCTVNFKNEYPNGNNTWSVVLSQNGYIGFFNGSKAHFTSHGIYSAPGGEINADNSEVELKNMEYTSIMGESYGKLNVVNSSKFVIDEAANPNGITGFDINVQDSEFTVKNCANQGLVKCNITISGKSVADVSSNTTGINLYSGNTLRVNEGARLNVNDNLERAVMTQGSKESVVEVKSGGFLEVKNNGSGFAAEYDDSKYYAERCAVAMGVYGWYEKQGKVLLYKNDVLNFEDGANVEICDNHVRGISNFGSAYIGNSTVIKNNSKNNNVERGGGIYNAGSLVLNNPAKVYNNHAKSSADDIYNEENATLQLGECAENLILDWCNHKINGWYDDSENNRWQAHAEEGSLHMDKIPAAKYEKLTEIKAAHNLENFSPSTNESSRIVWGWLVFILAVTVLFKCAAVLKANK